ncbi:HNH endonuclease signature motif containing protein [Amycolatopsis sp.]|uniref:HNH endonuclease n=1 Tax=Amycolatopsis sp. TaxID=37632 RepID=UPI002BD146E7|nr:HNH endonuclease signature motif containing protein [Amycolatopsis sp.]HVV11590.1 HNH endonuclease signature motif containing protein [Amycolatopsis sp.]
MVWQGSARRDRLPNDWNARRVRVLKRDRYRCQIQGPTCTGNATDVDHVTPGDNHSLGNLRAVCSACHSGKSSAEGVAARARLRAQRARPAERHPGRR